MSICIICIDTTFSGAAVLQRELDCNIVTQLPDAKGYSKILTRKELSFDNIPVAKHYIFAGAGVLTKVNLEDLPGKKSVLITDSHYLSNTKTIDQLIERYDIQVHCMADLWKFCKHEKKMYVHPFGKLRESTGSSDKFSICHSPYHKYYLNTKGSSEIQWAIDQLKTYYDIHYKCLINMSWQDAIKAKAQCNFFVDQLAVGNHGGNAQYKGGIGKSGLEAMLMGLLTFSSGDVVESDIPCAPFVQVNDKYELYKKMNYYINAGGELDSLKHKQITWSNKWTKPSTVINRILE